MSEHQAFLTDPQEEGQDLPFKLEALEIRECTPRLEMMKQIRRLRRDIRRFNQRVLQKNDLGLSSASGELGRGKLKFAEPEDTCNLKHLVHQVQKIETHLDALEDDYKEMLAEDDEVLIDLRDIEAKRLLIGCLMEKLENLQDQKQLVTNGCDDTITHPMSLVMPKLPPLPNLEINQACAHVQRKTEGSSSDSDASDVSHSELPDLQDLCSKEGPFWQALSMPVKLLATDEEEEEMMVGASILLGSDQQSKNIVAKFDESAAAFNRPGQLVGTSRRFLLNLPLMYVCNDRKCTICRAGFPLKNRAVRLPCRHVFHVNCILQWLLKKTTCPVCRREFPQS